jgi:putative protein-disulfide isomerase
LVKKFERAETLVFYFTDPTCSWCWATEPKIRRLQEEFRGHIRLIYKMGGLMEKWIGYRDPENNIRRPAQMAPRWADVARQTGMPIDERIWRDDPPLSTFPACIAFKAAQFQGERVSVRFLRRLREAVFLEGKNTAREDVLYRLARETGLNLERFKKDFKEGKAESAFRHDLEEAREQFILGFPTLLFRGPGGHEAKLYGYLDYESYRRAMDDVNSRPLNRFEPKSILSIVKKYEGILLSEATEMFGLEPSEAEERLEKLRKEKQVRRVKVGRGDFFWMPA